MLRLVFTLSLFFGIACGEELGVGGACELADDCFPGIDRSALEGDVECLTRVSGGYCTHSCDEDLDCCAVAGECLSDSVQVCAPFENSAAKSCFLACEPADIGDMDENEYCAEFAHPAFSCRSSGGGSENRKVCVP